MFDLFIDLLMLLFIPGLTLVAPVGLALAIVARLAGGPQARVGLALADVGGVVTPSSRSGTSGGGQDRPDAIVAPLLALFGAALMGLVVARVASPVDGALWPLTWLLLGWPVVVAWLAGAWSADTAVTRAPTWLAAQTAVFVVALAAVSGGFGAVNGFAVAFGAVGAVGAMSVGAVVLTRALSDLVAAPWLGLMRGLAVGSWLYAWGLALATTWPDLGGALAVRVALALVLALAAAVGAGLVERRRLTPQLGRVVALLMIVALLGLTTAMLAG